MCQPATILLNMEVVSGEKKRQQFQENDGVGIKAVSPTDK